MWRVHDFRWWMEGDFYLLGVVWILIVMFMFIQIRRNANSRDWNIATCISDVVRSHGVLMLATSALMKLKALLLTPTILLQHEKKNEYWYYEQEFSFYGLVRVLCGVHRLPTGAGNWIDPDARPGASRQAGGGEPAYRGRREERLPQDTQQKEFGHLTSFPGIW